MNQTPSQRQTDVIVIGGGPAGSTAAHLLAQRGYDVELFEKESFPRFHIGESLLPCNLPLLDKLGVLEQVAASAMKKNGIELISPTNNRSTFLEFSQSWDKTMPFAYQVRRSHFDQILLDRAGEVGATINQRHQVTSVSVDDDLASVTVTTDAGTEQHWQARFVVDASGRDTLLAKKFKSKQKNPDHNSAAVYAHYRDAERLPGEQEGNISLYWFDHGWFWFIPLADGVTSVGAVCWPYYLKTRRTDLNQFLADTIALSAPLQKRLHGATRVSDVAATGNFSYSAERTHGDNYLLLGDAYSFIDPVFSSGVYLAMVSAFAGADAIDQCLTQPAKAKSALKKFDRIVRKGPREFSWFIYRITSPTLRNIFLAPGNIFRVKEALLSFLAGDIYGKTPIWPSIYLFKLIYYLNRLSDVKGLFSARRQRQINIADHD